MTLVLKIVVPLLLFSFFSFQIFQMGSQYVEAKKRSLNTLYPNTFDALIDLAEAQVPLTPERLKSFLSYFQEVEKFFPERVDGIAMQGFCLYYLGRYELARQAYARASQKFPAFFGYRYNLAVIYFKLGQLEAGINELEMAMSYNPQGTISSVFTNTKIYSKIMMSKINTYNVSIDKQFEGNYRKVGELLERAKNLRSSNQKFANEDLALEVY